MDVSGLYTNIPNQEGLTAVWRTLMKHKYEGKTQARSLVKLLELVLHKNNFQFKGEHYLQVGGTAMGTKVAPTYANIFMGVLEEKLLATAPHKPSLYLRYIDDCFLICSA